MAAVGVPVGIVRKVQPLLVVVHPASAERTVGLEVAAIRTRKGNGTERVFDFDIGESSSVDCNCV